MLTNNMLRGNAKQRSVRNPLLPRENYWYAKNRFSKDLLMEPINEKEDDSFTRGMNDLNG